MLTEWVDEQLTQRPFAAIALPVEHVRDVADRGATGNSPCGAARLYHELVDRRLAERTGPPV